MGKISIKGRTSRGDCGGQRVIIGVGEKPRRQAEKNITLLLILLLEAEPPVPDLLHKLPATSKQGAEVDGLLLLLPDFLQLGRLCAGVEFWDSAGSLSSSHWRFGTPPSPGLPMGVLDLWVPPV